MKDDDTDSRFSPDRLRINPDEVRAVTPTKIKRRRERFTMVPGIWKEQLTKAQNIATYRVALHILTRDWENGGKPFTLANEALALENVSRWQKWRALEELERLGLITVERRKHKSPWITALHTAKNKGA